MNKTQFLNAIVIVSWNEFFAEMKIYVSLIFCFLAENRLKYGENGTIDLIFNYCGKIKIDRNFYDGRNFWPKFFVEVRDIVEAL